MLVGLIIACEILFWVLVFSGLACRYLWKQTKLSNLLLLLTPLVDLVLLAATIVSLRGGAEATLAHALAAVYIGVSIGYGHRMISTADTWFSFRFAGGPKPRKNSEKNMLVTKDPVGFFMRFRGRLDVHYYTGWY